MKIGKNGLDLIKHYEGLRLNAYPDPATGGEPYTIGYGHTGGVKLGDTITQEQADAFLLQDVSKAENYINCQVLQLTQNQFDALVCFTYNVGIGNLAKSTLLLKLKNKDYHNASLEFIKWDMAAGKHLAGLTKRRQAEQQLFLTKD